MRFLSGKMDFFSVRFAILGIVVLAACTSPVQRADSLIAQDEWMKAVLTYRKALAENPSDVEYKSRLKQTELKAADYYYQRGLVLLERENLDGAVVQFQQGLAAMPDHGKLLQAMRQVLLRKEANSLYAEAVRAKEAGKVAESNRLLKRAVNTYPDFKLAQEMLASSIRKLAEDDTGGRLKVSSHAPITLNFRQADVRTAFEFIAKSFGIDVVFDEAVRTMPVTLFAKDVTFEEAIDLILATTKTFYKTVGANTILIAPDNRDKRGQYEDQMVRVFQLTNIHAKEMASILQGVISLKKIIVNESLNTIIVRDTEEAIKVAEKVILVNDRRPAELILEVEILEVNRSKAEQLGLDLGSYNVKASTTAISLSGSIRNAVRDAATLTLPTATFNFYKQDVDAKTLANPRVRVLSGKKAKIHIGDRVPLRASTVQDATGQVRTTYDYKDIGIKLTADPIVHLDNSVTVNIGLEVSSLGQNIGTTDEPAYSIGTRNADTYMLLRDGETAILGGLIRDEDRQSRVKVPLLGDIPVLGYLFTSADDTNGRTDVLLTITPRVVRGWELPDKEERMFISGSEDRFSSQPIFGQVGKLKPRKKNVSKVTDSGTRLAGLPKEAAKAPAPPVGNMTAVTNNTRSEIAKTANIKRPPVVAFSKSYYEVKSGKDFELALTGESMEGVTGMTTELLYNTQMLEYVRTEPGSIATKNKNIDVNKMNGSIHISLAYPENAPAHGNGVLARIVLKGKKAGTSYIVYRDPSLSSKSRAIENVQIRATRVVVN